MLSGKRVVLGVTGSVAAFKAATLASLLKKEGCEVVTILTEAATKFIGPSTFSAITGSPVYIEFFENAYPFTVPHIELARWADLLVIAPATANTLAKISNGIADNALTQLALAFKGKIIVAPAMNEAMWENSVTQDNVKRLQKRGFLILTPGTGKLACGEGKGRLPEPEEILHYIKFVLYPKNLEGKTVLVTAGPTREPIDDVRFISNKSTGKMGFAIAKEAFWRGAKTVLITGPTFLADIPGVETIRVETAEEMYKEVVGRFESCHVVFMASAVADFKPQREKGKIKKTRTSLNLKLSRNPDILKELGNIKKHQKLIGFSLEETLDTKEAEKKLREKNLNMIILNTVEAMGSEDSTVVIIKRNGERVYLPKLSKQQIAQKIVEELDL